MIIDLYPVPYYNILASGVFSSSPVTVINPKIYDDDVAGQRAAECVYQVLNG